LKSEALEEKLIEDVSLWLNAGTMYGTHDGEGYMRWNIACPRSVLEEGLERFLSFTQKIKVQL
ncbi:MAG: cystathionine beta-lyase, partial [Muribaculaceae bacterium]|nr:cystathionine beta-lyase [Muribaculaceae bacterium]